MEEIIEKIQDLIVKYDDAWFQAEYSKTNALTVLPSIVDDLRYILSKVQKLQQENSRDKRNECRWYGGDCGSGEKCSEECFESSP